MIESIIFGIILIVVGARFFRKPDLTWELTERWKSYHADEPSDSYLRSTKLGGILCMLFGITIIILTLVIR